MAQRCHRQTRTTEVSYDAGTTWRWVQLLRSGKGWLEPARLPPVASGAERFVSPPSVAAAVALGQPHTYRSLSPLRPHHREEHQQHLSRQTRPERASRRTSRFSCRSFLC